MPPREFSRYTFSSALKDEGGRLFLTDPTPFRYRERSDNTIHEVKRGDTLGGLAARYFKGFRRASGLWWILAWYQPEPIHDPTISLEPGRKLVIPSLATVLDVFNESRRSEG